MLSGSRETGGRRGAAPIGSLYVGEGRDLRERRIAFSVRRPLGAARVAAADSAEGASSAQPDALLPGVLRLAGSAQPAHRFPVACRTPELDEHNERILLALRSHGGLDPCWIAVFGCRLHDPGERDWTLLLLTQDQMACAELSGPTADFELPTTQVVTAVASGMRGPPAQPLPYWRQRLDLEGVRLGDGVFQVHPSYRYAVGDVEKPHSYNALLNPGLGEAYPRGFALLRNTYLEAEYPDLRTSFPVMVNHDERVPLDAVALDGTIVQAVGLREGETCHLDPMRTRRSLARQAFRYRHAACRVLPVTSVDMEKPVARMPLEVFDVLGIPPDAQLVIEGFDPASNRVRRLKLRALELRPRPHELRPEGPDYVAEVGGLDLSPITLDRVRRDALGVSAGSAVYVRPALASVVVQELSAVLLLLAAAVFGAMVSRRWYVAALIGLAYLCVVAVRTLGRFR